MPLFVCILQTLGVWNLELFLCMSCLGLLVHAVRRAQPVLPYVCPHTSLVPLPQRLWGAGHCSGMDPWRSAGPALPHPQGVQALDSPQMLHQVLKWLFCRNDHCRVIQTQNVSGSSPMNSLPSCFGFTDAASQENWLRTQNHLYLAMGWDCKAKLPQVPSYQIQKLQK